VPNIFWRFFGFGEDDYEEEDEEYPDYEEGQPRTAKKIKGKREREEPRKRAESPKLVFFKGVPSEGIRLRLRDALLEGTMVLLDLQGLPAEHVEEGRTFINFMGGVAFAHKGLIERIGASLFLITPREGMLQWWAEEGE
jgi:FtsZ-interacting cell division protein YlmF